MRILSLLVLIVAAYFVAHGDQHAGRATVIAADGRVWNNVRMDWTLAGDLQLRDPIGHPVASLSEKTTSYSYETDSWYLGVFAWVAFAVTIGYGAYALITPLRRVLGWASGTLKQGQHHGK
jgi:hypothetical protein